MIGYLVPYTTVSIMLIAWLAAHVASVEAARIENGLPIAHAAKWRRVVLLVLVAMGVPLAIGAWKCGLSAWTAVPMALMAYGYYTPLNRMMLNRMRDLPVLYINTGNRYDELFLWLFRRNLPAASIAQYVIEALCFFAGLMTAFLMNTNQHP